MTLTDIEQKYLELPIFKLWDNFRVVCNEISESWESSKLLETYFLWNSY